MIERIFGVLKCHFWILLLPPKYHINIQARIPAVLCAIHNFICIHDADDALQVDGKRDDMFKEDIGVPFSSGLQETSEDELGRAEQDEGTHVAVMACLFHDQITQAMWDNFQHIVCERNYVDGSDGDASAN